MKSILIKTFFIVLLCVGVIVLVSACSNDAYGADDFTGERPPMVYVRDTLYIIHTNSNSSVVSKLPDDAVSIGFIEDIIFYAVLDVNFTANDDDLESSEIFCAAESAPNYVYVWKPTIEKYVVYQSEQHR